MSEKRKPDAVIGIRWDGRKAKIELFNRSQWEASYRGRKEFRIRVKGKWFGARKRRYFTKWQVRDMIWRQFL